MNRYLITTLGVLFGLIGATRATQATPLYRVADLGAANWGASLSLDDLDHISSNVIVGPGLMIPQCIALECFEGREYSVSAVQYGVPLGLSHRPGVGQRAIGGALYVGDVYGSIQADNALLGSSAEGDAFLSRDGSVIDLNHQLVPSEAGWWLQRADAMNSEGQIVGIGIVEGKQDIVLLTPVNFGDNQGAGILPWPPVQAQTMVPEPDCLSLLSIGVAILIIGRWSLYGGVAKRPADCLGRKEPAGVRGRSGQPVA